MSDRRVDTLILEGKDSLEFANSFFRPSVEQLEKNREYYEKLEHEFSIKETDDGFDITIAKPNTTTIDSEVSIDISEADLAFACELDLNELKKMESRSVVTLKTNSQKILGNTNGDMSDYECLTIEDYKKANRDSLYIAA